MAITNKEIEEAEQRKREFDTKLRMHEASMGGNIRLPRKSKKETTAKEPWQPTHPLKTIDQSSTKQDPAETQEELTQKYLSMATKVMETKGVQDMMTSPVMPASFKTNPARKPESTEQNSEASPEQKPEETTKKTSKSKKTIKKDPDYSTVVPGMVRPLKFRESVADILGKMYNFMRRRYIDDSRQYKKEKKYKKKLVAIKERRIEELIHLFGGKYIRKPMKSKDESFFSKLLRYAIVGGVLFFLGSKMALASVSQKIKDTMPEIPDFMSFLGKKPGDKKTSFAPGVVDESLHKITFNQLSQEQKKDFIDAQAHAEGSDKPGSIGYRNNNPGNIVTNQKGQAFPAQAKFGGVAGDRSKSSGLEFVKFPSWEAGRAAQIDLWERKYGDLPLDEALKEWVKPKGAKEEKEFANYKANQFASIKKSEPVTLASSEQKSLGSPSIPTPTQSSPATPTPTQSSPATPTPTQSSPATPTPAPIQSSTTTKTIPPVTPQTNKSGTQNISMLNNNTNIINGSTNMAITSEDRNNYPPLIEKQYYTYS